MALSAKLEQIRAIVEREEETPFTKVLKETSKEQIKWLMKMLMIAHLSMEKLGMLSAEAALVTLLDEARFENGREFERELRELYDLSKYSSVNVLGSVDREILRRFKMSE